jgi:predicted AlkP superfamily pyrophosphatase or phosphodiesterase
MLIDSIDNDTLLIISADHGQIDTTNKKTIHLREFEESKNIILPVSDVRAPYIYTNGKLQKEFFERFENIVALEKTEAINLGLFGDSVHFEERIGDYVIIIKDDSSLDFISEESELNLLGKHGNLTEDEMLVPLILYYK